MFSLASHWYRFEIAIAHNTTKKCYKINRAARDKMLASKEERKKRKKKLNEIICYNIMNEINLIWYRWIEQSINVDIRWNDQTISIV